MDHFLLFVLLFLSGEFSGHDRKRFPLKSEPSPPPMQMVHFPLFQKPDRYLARRQK